MKHKLTLVCCLLITTIFSPLTSKSQFLTYFPSLSNYIRSDVKNENSGLTFTYRLQNDTTLALSALIMHTDNNGQMEWMKIAGSNFSSYTTAADNSVIITGGRSTSAGNRIALLQKMDSNGNVIWKKSLAASSADVNIGNIMINANNTIFATITRSSFFSNTYMSKAGVIAFDSNGQVLWTKFYSNAGLTTDYNFTRTLLASNGDFIGVADVRGSAGASANGLMITRITPLGTIVFSKYIDFSTTHNQLSVTGLVETSSNDIIFGGRLMTDQFSIYPNTMWLGKMDSAGDMTMQKIYSGGEDVGEQLHSLRYDNGTLFAYMHNYSPFDSIRKSIWIGVINEQTLAFTSQNATEIEVHLEDVYGNVSNSFCITSDGKPTVSAGFNCLENNKYFPLMQQWSSSLASSCSSLDAIQPMIDSDTNYVAAAYTPVGTFTVTHAADTTTILITNVTPAVTADLCNGCSTVTSGVNQIQQIENFVIYPNPSDGHYFIDMDQEVQEATIMIYNSLGAIVYESKLHSTHQSLDLSEQMAGIYFVKVQTNDGRVTISKLIKNR